MRDAQALKDVQKRIDALLQKSKPQSRSQELESPKPSPDVRGVVLDHDCDHGCDCDLGTDQFDDGAESQGKMHAKLRAKAMDFLSFREYTQSQLRTKLLARFEDASDASLTSVLQKLQDEGLQSDARFAESLIREKRRLGKGVRAIEMLLMQAGVHQDIARPLLSTLGAHALDDALRVLEKKYQNGLGNDAKEKGKALRFLASRGFAQGVCYAAIASFVKR